MTTANFATPRTIHESQSSKIVPVHAKRATGRGPRGILTYSATLPCGQRHVKFTLAATSEPKGRHAFNERSSPDDFFR
jgi:hypothetical protein